MIVAFRRHTLLPLDDCLYALQPTIPHLDALVVAPLAPGAMVSRLPQVEGEASPKRRLAHPIGYFRTSTSRRFEPPRASSISLSPSTGPRSSPLSNSATSPQACDAADFLRRLIEAVPYKVHTVLTDNGTHFTPLATRSPVEIREMIAEQKPFRAHAFEYACATNDVDHRLTKPKHPWTNGQVERMNRTIKDATVKRYFYETHEQLRTHLRDFVDAYNFARRLKTLKGLTPYEFVCKAWTSQPQRFKLNPLQQMPGLNN